MSETYTPEQTRENRALWVAALRSEKYEQGTGALNKSGRFCCLGVACEIAIESGLEVKRDGVDGRGGLVRYDRWDVFLPQTVRDWLGLRNNSGEYRADSLVARNDSGDFTFAQIADLIESEPPGLLAPGHERGDA